MELVAVLGRDTRRTVIVLPDLHEADTVELVLDLLQLPHVRLVVESRSGSAAHQVLSDSAGAELDLDLEQWRDQHRFEQWLASRTEDQDGTVPGIAASAGVDLSDPADICEADPWQVTVAYERDSDHDHGGLRAAWLRAGQSLCREQPAASRALALLCVLGDSADPRLVPALTELSAQADWDVRWSRVRGDVAPPWPGAVATLAMGKGPLADCLLVAGPGGVVKSLDAGNAVPRGRLPQGWWEPADITVMADGTVLVLDETGQVHAEANWAARLPGSGIARLLDDSPSGMQLLRTTVQEHTGTALASGAGFELGFVALGGPTGVVRTFGDFADSASLHRGPVSALAAVSIPLDGETALPLIYSGGADGTVRAWSPGHAAMTAPLVHRSSPVIGLDAAVTAMGRCVVVAWGDGLVQWIRCDSDVQQTFQPGPPVRAIALDRNGCVFVGMDEALVCLTPRQELADEVRSGS
ncbi:hypothetical protein QBA37_35115 [Streptomyces silvae]|uniref:WD40 repeat domain-containing protein n=1 Tax=Streptomyces silvae TaxID=2803812 RepID=A0ABU8ADE3_9ACTN